MNQLSRMLREIALVYDYGFDANQAEDALRSRELKPWAVAKLGDPGQKRMHALSELTAWRDMDGEELVTTIQEANFQRYLDLAIQQQFTRMYEKPDPAAMREVMTTAQFQAYFTDALDRKFYADYGYQTGSWNEYVFQDTVPDFRNVKRIRMSEPEGLQVRGEKESRRETWITPSVVDYGVDEYSRTFNVSWRVILNDDLGKIRETPNRMAAAARRWLDDFVSNLYDNATTQAALVALGALYAGTGALTLPNLAVAVNAMMQRTDANGNRIVIQRVHLVIPPVLQVQAAQILQDLISYGGPNSNVMTQFIAGVHVDPYIAYTSPNIPWYLVADKSSIPTITLARMQGVSGPFVFMKQSDIRMLQGTAPAAFLLGDFETGNIVYAVEDIVGGWEDATYGGVTDYRGLWYSSGTTA